MLLPTSMRATRALLAREDLVDLTLGRIPPAPPDVAALAMHPTTQVTTSSLVEAVGLPGTATAMATAPVAPLLLGPLVPPVGTM